MNSGLNTNIEEVFAQFVELEKKEMTAACKKALKKGAAELKKQTVANLKPYEKGKSMYHYGGQVSPYTDKITDAVRISKFNDRYDEELSLKVHIMGTTASGSGTYRARFINNGTQDRYATTYKGNSLRKPRYTGRIQGSHFFQQAQGVVFPQLESIYMTEIEAACNKINNNKQNG